MVIKMARQRVTKKWQLFPGRNKFYCDGFLMTAPNSSIFYLTVVLITGTSGLFFAFDCPFLAQRITVAIPIVGGILYVFTMCSLLRTSFSDPGIIPRASQDEAAYIEKQIEVPNALNSPTYRPPPRTKEIFVRGQTVKLKYCFTCKIFRPPRASHCSLCDNCVDRFDHHCPWVGNCVGRRNYRFFYMFIVSLAFLAVFIFACALTHLVLLQTETRDFLDVIRISPFSVVVSAICFLSVWSVIGLAGFHTYLTTSDQTTNEDIKGSFSSKGGGQQSTNPYSRGNICLNCFYILCGPLQPSLIDRRGVVTEEYRLQMQTQDKFNGMPAPPMVVQPLGSVDPMKGYNNVDLEVPTNANNHLPGGVYRQRSYDNLQNGKSPFHRSSIKSLHLPPTYGNQQQHHHQINKKLSLNNINVGKFPQLSPNFHRGYSPSPQHHHQMAQIIPTNFKYVAPQSKYQSGDPSLYDSNSLPRYPYHKNRAIQSVHHRYDGACMEYYKHGPVRHPTTPPPPPPNYHQKSTEEQVLLPTPTSSSSSGDTFSNSEWDPMIASGSGGKRVSGFDHMAHYRTCKKQIQQATQLLQPNTQHQSYLDNYLNQFTHQSPYRKYLNAVQNHQLQLSPQNIHHQVHNQAKRHSNVYEYHFTNFDLNSIHEDAMNES